ncbi:MAG TPA: nicotinate (nicotinamide) nucleotide adenylyltransferase [Candidatus Marinimicrobia bacterium]|nr:nicotinate (nicotinamide) nucleotide adenylyltransferase [Candidatus Neomarinimicrobiota bacterium]
MKICLFGGTFDPPHIGHLLISQTICEVEEFDKILFIPAYNPPHKKDISPIDHRVEMVKLSISGNPKFEFSDIEIKREGISYTIDTIRALKKEMNLTRENTYYLMGSDSLLDFHNWREPEAILNECQVIVAIRPGFRPSDIQHWILHRIQFANIPRYEIASTTIRARWIENMTIRYMVTLPVWDYIHENKLYEK